MPLNCILALLCLVTKVPLNYKIHTRFVDSKPEKKTNNTMHMHSCCIETKMKENKSKG